MDTKTKVAVVGHGYWGPNLVRNFYQLPASELVACCDLDENNLTKIEEQYPTVRTTTDYNSLLSDPEIEAIVLATPAPTHYELAAAALNLVNPGGNRPMAFQAMHQW